jgi:hypothetical protein
MPMRQPDVPEEQRRTRAAVASYLATITGDLAALARQAGFDVLGFILAMARAEARLQARASRRTHGRPPQETDTNPPA